MSKRFSCFVIMPYSEQSDLIFKKFIVPVLRNLSDYDVLTLRADTMGRSEITLKAHVESAVRAADFCIADVTGNNPNVMYELGYAHAINKPIVLIGKSKESHLPVNLSGLLQFEYSVDYMPEFQENLKKVCIEILNSISSLKTSSHISHEESELSISSSLDDRILNRLYVSTQKRLFALVGSPRLLVERILPALLSMGRSGLDIRIICANPEGEFARIRSKDSNIAVSSYRAELWSCLKQLHDLLQMLKGCHTELRVTEAMVPSSVYIVDDIALILPYMSSGQSREAATIVLSKTDKSNVFSIYDREFMFVWSKSIKAVNILGRSTK